MKYERTESCLGDCEMSSNVYLFYMGAVIL